MPSVDFKDGFALILEVKPVFFFSSAENKFSAVLSRFGPQPIGDTSQVPVD